MNPRPASRLPMYPRRLSHAVSPDHDEASPSCHHRHSQSERSLSIPIEKRTFDRQAGPCLQRSKSIPIANGMKRTPSELQLHEDEQVADFRDYLMFSRIVDGITRQQEATTDYKLRQTNDMCLAHIIGTRNLSEEELKEYNRLERPQFSVLPQRTSFDNNSLKYFLGQTFQEELEEQEMFALEL